MYDNLRTYYTRFVNPSDAEWAELVKRTTIVKLKKGDFVLKAHQVCNSVWYINKGLIYSYYLVEGKESIIGFIPQNEYISDYSSFLKREESNQYIRALTDVELYALSYDDMQFMYSHYPVFQEFGRKIAEMLFNFLTERVESLLLEDAETRYKKLVAQWPNIQQLVPQYMIASYLSITPETLSRIRSKLSKSG